MAQLTQIEERALHMLGANIPQVNVALALGVSESRVSQMLADEEFARQVSELRFQNLNKYTEIDDKYATIEGKLLEKLEKVIPLLVKPRDVLQAVSVVNSAKRRGAVAETSGAQSTQIVQLSIPVTIAHKFVSNTNNQIIEVHDDRGDTTELVTVQSSRLDELSRQILQHEPTGSGQISSDEIAKSTQPKLSASQELIQRAYTPALSAGPRESKQNQVGNPGKVTVEDL